MTPCDRSLRWLQALAVVLLLALSFPSPVAGHAELERSAPPDGGTVEAPFDGPILLEFTEELGDGSRAELQDDGGGVIAEAAVDGPGATMAFELDVALGPGAYRIAWTAIAVDGHVERGTVTFAITPAPRTPEPTPAAPTTEPSGSNAPASPSPEPTPAASPSPSSTPADAASSSDVVIPIVAALLVVALGGAFLVSRRGRPTP